MICHAGFNRELPEDSGSDMNMFPALNFSCDGDIGAWEVFTKYNVQGFMYLGAWRKLEGDQYKLVGQNRIAVLKKGLQSIPIPENERIHVSKGDFIGVHFDSPGASGLISYENNNNYKSLTGPIHNGDIAANGGIIALSQLRHANRIVSAKAIIIGKLFPFIKIHSLIPRKTPLLLVLLYSLKA